MKIPRPKIKIAPLVIAIVAVVALGFAGWSVTSAIMIGRTDTSSAPSSKSPQSIVPGWQHLTSIAGNYQLEHPDYWAVNPDPLACPAGETMMGAISDAIGTGCNGSAGQMTVVSYLGNVTARYVNPPASTEASVESLTVGGIAGKKITRSLTDQEVTDQKLGPAGTQLVQYVFYTKGRTYVLSYYGEAAYPYALDDFNQMVTKTLQFFAE